jgi:hypothetical protein
MDSAQHISNMTNHALWRAAVVATAELADSVNFTQRSMEHRGYSRVTVHLTAASRTARTDLHPIKIAGWTVSPLELMMERWTVP